MSNMACAEHGTQQLRRDVRQQQRDSHVAA
jgi:hypothetical protein